MYLMERLSEKEIERRKGVFQDLVLVETILCNSSMGLLGPPVQRIREWVKVDVPKKELRERILHLVREGIAPTFEVENAKKPYGPRTEEWEGRSTRKVEGPVSLSELKLEKCIERSTPVGDTAIELTFSGEFSNGGSYSITVQECHAQSRRAVINAALQALGMDPKHAEVVRDDLYPDRYEIVVCLTGEMWIKCGTSTILRGPEEQSLAHTVVSGVLSAVKNAENDPRPRRRRMS